MLLFNVGNVFQVQLSMSVFFWRKFSHLCVLIQIFPPQGFEPNKLRKALARGVSIIPLTYQPPLDELARCG